MREKNLSNSELARRVGVTPPAIRDIVNGRAYNSRHLHKIARELGTTPAWLTGETDDPDSDQPDVPPMSIDERELIDCYRQLPSESRAALLHIAQTMIRSDSPTVHAPRLAYRAGPGAG